MSLGIIGYRASGQGNDSTAAPLGVEQRELVRPILSSHNGKEFKTKPEHFLVEFPSPIDAAKCASDVQKMVREYNTSAPPKLRMKIRIGIHTGQLVEAQGSISGEAAFVPRSITRYASICLTREVADQLGNRFRRPLQSLGTRTVKGSNGQMELFKVVLPWEAEEEESKGFDKTRIAVLPFVNNSPNPADDYFADGITEELIGALSRVAGLKVIARSSAMSHKGGQRPVEEIARELEVGTVLEGSVKKTGDRIRLTTELVDASTGERLWGENYERQLSDMPGLESDVAQRVARELKVRLSPREKVWFARKRVVVPEVYSLYLRGKSYLNRATRESVDWAVRSLKQAIHFDPEFAPAYAGLADCYNAQADRYWAPPGLAALLAKTASTKALEIDPSIGEAHAALGLVLSDHYWEFVTAENEFKRAITLSPSYAPGHHWYATLLLYTRRFEDSYEEEKQALLHDPDSPMVNIGMANLLAILGRTDEAMERYRQLLELGEEYGECHTFKSMLHTSLSQLELATTEAKKALDREKSTLNQATLSWAYAAAGNRRETEKILDEMSKRTENEPVLPVWVALTQFALGKQDEALRMLEKALIVKDPHLLVFRSLPWFRNYLLDDRWKRIEARLNLPSN